MSPPRSSHTPPALVSYAVDASLIGALAWPAVLFFQWRHVRFTPGLAEYFSLLVVCPHYTPTVLRLYSSASRIRAHWVSAVAAPVVFVLALLGASFGSPRFTMLFASTYGVWRLYHYSAQTFGIASLYAGREGLELTPTLRRSLGVLLFGSSYWYLLSHPAVFTVPVLDAFHFSLPQHVRYGAACLIAAAASHVLWRWLAVGKVFYFPLFAIPIAAHLLFLYETPRSAAVLVIAGAYHSAQYLFLSGVLARRESALSQAPDVTWLGRRGRSPFWLAWCLAGGALLYVGLKATAACLGWGGVAPAYAYALPVMAVNFHHFLADGFLWRRRRRPEVGLLGNSNWRHPLKPDSIPTSAQRSLPRRQSNHQRNTFPERRFADSPA